MRAPVLALSLLLLAGCAGRDAVFEKEADGPQGFARDDDACAAAALLKLPDRAVSYDRNLLFNRLYGDCMHARGYASGPYARALPESRPAPGAAPRNS